ncbi:unnamed protein product [Rotaria sp. Silwood1]|nr:unnamed protein product [Rotaria sp. Silwood1]
MLPPRTLMLYFEQGRPMPIDEQRLNFVKFVRELNKIGLQYGLPWQASVESRHIGKGEIEWSLTPGIDTIREANIVRGGLHNTTTVAYINIIRELCTNATGLVELTLYPSFVRTNLLKPDRPVAIVEVSYGD